MTATGSTADPAPSFGNGPSSGSGPAPAPHRLLYITEEQTAAQVDEELALEAARAAAGRSSSWPAPV